MSMQSQPAIRLRSVSKRFTFTRDTPRSVLEWLIALFSRRHKEAKDLWAVRDVSFDVMPGQCVGIVGRNGSGKSTLLKLIARIIQPTSGEIMVRGRISALLELGAGFHPDLTGRENIYLNASVLGLGREETTELFDEIVEFSELGDFIDMSVKHYSSGMYMRLGFSVAIHVRPDILIVDEILAVGDQSFQAKCLDRIMEMKRNGTTILFISHDMDSVGHLCSDVVWLDRGEVRMVGLTEHVLAHYSDSVFQQVGDRLAAANEASEFQRWGTQQIQITDVRLVNEAGGEATVFGTGDFLAVEIYYIAHEPIDEPEFRLAIHTLDGIHIAGSNTRTGEMAFGVVEGEGVVRYDILRLPLVAGRYQISVSAHHSVEPVTYDYHEAAYSFQVTDDGVEQKEGLINLDATWEWLPEQQPLAPALPLAG